MAFVCKHRNCVLVKERYLSNGIDNNLKIFWTDEFGKGWLKIIFDETFESFTGEWGAIKKKKEKGKEGEWTGKRLY